jgi:hypothetical protein
MTLQSIDVSWTAIGRAEHSGPIVTVGMNHVSIGHVLSLADTHVSKLPLLPAHRNCVGVDTPEFCHRLPDQHAKREGTTNDFASFSPREFDRCIMMRRCFASWATGSPAVCFSTSHSAESH